MGKGQRSKERQRAPVDKGVQGRCHRVQCRKGRVMREARTILQLLRERGKKRLPLERVYRLLFNPNLYLMAYGKIYRNHGAMTKGTTEETADGMSKDKIATIIDAVRHERYRWKPARRIYIPKKDGRKRPLGIQSWSDKLLQEVVRLSLAPIPMGSDQNADATRHCGKSTTTGWERFGSSRAISRNVSTRFLMNCCSPSCEKPSRMNASCVSSVNSSKRDISKIGAGTRPTAVLPRDQLSVPSSPTCIWINWTSLSKPCSFHCGTTGDAERIEVHHIRALKDLKTYDGREKPAWVKIMSARKRKTLVLCATCHQDVTYGRPMRRKPKSVHATYDARKPIALKGA